MKRSVEDSLVPLRRDSEELDGVAAANDIGVEYPERSLVAVRSVTSPTNEVSSDASKDPSQDARKSESMANS